MSNEDITTVEFKDPHTALRVMNAIKVLSKYEVEVDRELGVYLVYE